MRDSDMSVKKAAAAGAAITAVLLMVMIAVFVLRSNPAQAQTGIQNEKTENGYVTGEVIPADGYDVATVRYVFADKSYGIAQLNKTENGYEYKYPVQDKAVTTTPEYFSTEKWDGAIDLSWYDPDKTDYTISDGAQLAGLAAIVNGSYDASIPDYRIKGNTSYIKNNKIDNFQLTGAGGGNQYATVYQATAATDMMGKTVHITSDIDMGGVYSSSTKTWSGPDYMPVGGKYRMDPDTADGHLIEAFFNGVLDGGGHKIYNIRCDRYTDLGYAYSQAVGLVGYIGDLYDGETLQTDWQPAVKDLSVNGYIYGRRMVGGAVGRVGDISSGVTVENCANHAEVHNTDSKGVGGIVGAAWGKGDIRNCYNTGSITTTYTCPAGGICGSNGGMNIYSCYNAGRVDSNGAKRGRGIGGHDSGTYTVDNCYYLEGCDDDADSHGYYKGTALNISVDAASLTEAEMKSSTAVPSLNDSTLIDCLNVNGAVFAADTSSQNGGYPILYFEAPGYVSPGTHTVTVEQPAEGGTIKADRTGSVPNGTVVKLSDTPDNGYILSAYKANGKELLGNFCTVTSDVTITADFIKLRKGTLSIGNSKDCTVSLTKTGMTSDSGGSLAKVVNQQVLNGRELYQKDELSAAAVLDKNAAPEDKNKEYSGNFTYYFKYIDADGKVISQVSTDRGKHTVTTDIADALTGSGNTLEVTAVPYSQDKSWLTLADTSWYDKKSDEYTLTTPEQLAGLAYLVNEEKLSFKGITIDLGNSISLKNNDGTSGVRLWPGIGTSADNSFMGTFDGKGYTVRGMSASTDSSYSGLFKYAGSGSKIKDLTVRGTSHAKSGAAGIAGCCSGASISGCISYADAISAEGFAGGISAYVSDGTAVSKCINRGNVSASFSAGGIAGQESDKADVIGDSVNYGSVSGTGDETGGTGGICGKMYGSIRGCANCGDVSGAGWYTGGVAGRSDGSSGASIIKDSYNRGSVCSSSTRSAADAGGIVGYAHYIVLKNAYNTGDVSGVAGYIGSICGYLYNSGSNSIAKTYYLKGSAAKAIGKINNDAAFPYEAEEQTATAMKSSGFAAMLNSNSTETKFASAADDYPLFAWLKNTVTHTVTFTGDYTGSIEVYDKASITLPELDEAGYEYVFTCNGKTWDGTDITADAAVDVVRTAVKYTATFMADGDIVKSVTFEYGTSSIDEPEIPVKAGYTAVGWSSYKLGAADITIKAIYKQNIIKGGETPQDGQYYFIGAKSTGVITIPENTEVTFDGANGMCDNLRIVMEKNSVLHMKDVQLTSEDKVLTMQEGSRLILEGDSRLEGASTEEDNENPTVDIQGDCTIDGSGSLYLTAETGNACLNIAAGKTLKQTGGTVKIYKDSKLGIKGGALYAPEASYDLSGGTLASVAASDNLYSVYIKNFIISNGEALIYTMDEAKALSAENIDLTGGMMKVTAREHDTHEYYYNEDAIDCSQFTGSHYFCGLNAGTAVSRPYKVNVDGALLYQGSGLGLDFADGEFISKEDSNLYLWLTKGEDQAGTHKISLNGTEISANKALVDKGYYTSADKGRISVTLLKPYESGWRVAAAAYDADGKMLVFKSVPAALETKIDLGTVSPDKIKVFVFSDMSRMIPALSSTTIKY